jgi:hypothetical protein
MFYGTLAIYGMPFLSCCFSTNTSATSFARQDIMTWTALVAHGSKLTFHQSVWVTETNISRRIHQPKGAGWTPTPINMTVKMVRAPEASCSLSTPDKQASQICSNVTVAPSHRCHPARRPPAVSTSIAIKVVLIRVFTSLR